MAVGANIIVDLSDNDDDDCVLEAVIYNSKSKHFGYDNIFKENPLLAQCIEKCLNLESTEGMLRVINKTLLEVYKEADPKFKSSTDFETALKRTMIRLDKDPNHKFSHIKDLCETLRSSKFKKRVKLITLEKKKKPNGTGKMSLKRKSYLDRTNKKQKTDIIDLDKYEEIPTIDLDLNDTDNGSPIVIDDEKENHSSQENGDCFTEIINRDELILHQNSQNLNSKGNSEDANEISHVINHSPNTTNIECTQQNDIAIDNSDTFSKKNTVKLLAESKSDTPESPEKLLVPQKVSAIHLSTEDEPSSIDLEKIKNIEREIAIYKNIITKLDEEEVTDDSLSSPYVRSEKYKEKIVLLYKELCTLTGSEATKRREVTLTVIEGHPPGPVKGLESFLNRNIGSDGNPPFPDFNDVVKCVATANVNDNLGWNKNQVMREASALFTHCGRALQKRRKKREWKDLLSRVKAEQCEWDPADDDAELLARLEANKRVAVKKESDLLERYSMMQNLPPDRTDTTNVTQPQDADDDASMKSVSDDSSDECDLLQGNLDKNKILAPTKANLIQNDGFVMPQITMAESITNKSFTDEFGLKIIDSKEISNVKVNFAPNIAVNFESNVGEDNLHCNDAKLCGESSFEDGNFQSNDSNVARLRFESNVEDNLNSYDGTVHFGSNAEKVNNNSEVNSTETTVKTEMDIVKIETDPTKNIANLLNNFGDNYTVSILEIEDPFFVIEISDSSDED